VTGWVLADLGSRNGGFVDGRAFPPNARTALGDGATVRVGNALLVFRTSPAIASGSGDIAAFPGMSLAAANFRRRLSAAVAGQGHVLVVGETGTGKERVARAFASSRAPAPIPLVVQNCAELTRDLARSELFGHLRGAFTGAQVNRIGLVEAADDGVLFLDEIGELALDVQGDLLRFLEDGSYRPIGSHELRHSQARVVAATNVDLDQAVRAGKFRRDLLARLRASNVPIELPPLRDRREDIAHWAQMFLVEAGYAISEPLWKTGALECLLLYPWHDNLRELRKVIRSLVAEQVPAPFEAEALPEELRKHRASLRARRDDSALAGLRNTATEPRSAPIELTREMIESALRSTEGNVQAAAKVLGIERTKLYRRCAALGISIEGYRDEPSEEH
jgi:DNA-binding NtrC family response regulator